MEIILILGRISDFGYPFGKCGCCTKITIVGPLMHWWLMDVKYEP